MSPRVPPPIKSNLSGEFNYVTVSAVLNNIINGIVVCRVGGLCAELGQSEWLKRDEFAGHNGLFINKVSFGDVNKVGTLILINIFVE
mgnify:CR=1 FL=1